MGSDNSKEKDPSKQDKNLRFYRNEIKSKPWPGHTVTEMLGWYGNYDKLEYNHSYIQWLFPIPKASDFNSSAQPLHEHESNAIKEDVMASARVLEAYQMMLDFYGMRLLDDISGEVVRSKNWPSRYEHLNRSTHNYRRITRILQSLGELGYERYQVPWITFLMEETIVNQVLPNLRSKFMTHWIVAVKDDGERNQMMENYWGLFKRPVSQQERIAPSNVQTDVERNESSTRNSPNSIDGNSPDVEDGCAAERLTTMSLDQQMSRSQAIEPTISAANTVKMVAQRSSVDASEKQNEITTTINKMETASLEGKHSESPSCPVLNCSKESKSDARNVLQEIDGTTHAVKVKDAVTTEQDINYPDNVTYKHTDSDESINNGNLPKDAIFPSLNAVNPGEQNMSDKKLVDFPTGEPNTREFDLAKYESISFEDVESINCKISKSQTSVSDSVIGTPARKQLSENDIEQSVGSSAIQPGCRDDYVAQIIPNSNEMNETNANTVNSVLLVAEAIGGKCVDIDTDSTPDNVENKGIDVDICRYGLGNDFTDGSLTGQHAFHFDH